MSLDVSPSLLEQAEHGEIDEAEFVDCVRTSLPYAWNLISSLATEFQVEGGEFVDNQVPPASEKERGQLLRALASDSIRGALERHFRVRLAFQNCHRVAVFAPDSTRGDTYRKFVSTRAQVLNQSAELRDC
jgi:hypothetical protein